MPFIRTSVVQTRIERLEVSNEGLTVGQQVDMRIAELMREPGDGRGGPPPRLHELTFGFESDEDFYAYERRSQELGLELANPETLAHIDLNTTAERRRRKGESRPV